MSGLADRFTLNILKLIVGQVDVVIGRFSKVLATEMFALDDGLSTLAQKDPRRAQGSDVMAVICGVAGETCRRVTDQGRCL